MTSARSWLISLWILPLLVAGSAAPSQVLQPLAAPASHVRWSVSVEPEKARPGDTIHVVAKYEVAKGWHLYAPDFQGTGLATKLKVDTSLLQADGKPKFPAPEIKEVQIIEKEIHRLLSGTGDIRQAYVVSAEAPPGKLDFKALLTYMGCSDATCDPPKMDEPYPLSVEVAESAGATEGPADDREAGPEAAAASEGDGGGPPPAAGGAQERDLLRVGIWALIALMIGGGFLALIMPCTYPMIPITIAYFTHQAEARKGAVLPLALAYGAGIVLSFNIIGWAFAPVIGPFAANPWVNLVFAILFLAFGLSFVGLFNIRLPRAINNLSAKAQGATGYLGVLALGATLVIASFACTAPIMGPLLVIAAGGESLIRVTVGMTAFGATMAAPFVLLALFPARLQAMPRSGEWMHTVKVFLGFVLLASSLLFFNKADQAWSLGWLARESFLVLWTAIFAAASLHLLGLIRLADEERKGIGSLRLLAGVAALALALYFHLASRGYPLSPLLEAFLPDPRAGDAAAGTLVDSRERRIKDLVAGLEAARARGLKALVNFSGVVCTNCKLMERSVFPKVSDLLEKFVEIRLKTDQDPGMQEKRQYQQKLTRSLAIPAYVIVDPDKPDEPIDTFTGADLTGGEKFREFLRRNID